MQAAAAAVVTADTMGTQMLSQHPTCQHNCRRVCGERKRSPWVGAALQWPSLVYAAGVVWLQEDAVARLHTQPDTSFAEHEAKLFHSYTCTGGTMCTCGSQ
jgi:hypothetical protein